MRTILLKQLALFLTVIISVFANAQSYTTVANGSWSASTTWLGGSVPPATILAARNVTVKHFVVFNVDSDLKIYGNLNVYGGTLYFPTSYSKRTSVFIGGQLNVLNGSFLQSTADRNSDVYAEGGRMRFDNALVTVGKAFKATSGSRRIFKNSSIRVGEGYESQGSSSQPVYDTIQYSTIEVSVAGGGHFEVKDHCHTMVANAVVLVQNGELKTSSDASVATMSAAVGQYGFDKLKTSSHLDNAAPWKARIYSHCVGGDIKGSNAVDIDFDREEDCSLAARPVSSNAGQLVINEIYTAPNAGNHEFFELYNIGNQAESLDNYTFVSFFKTSTETGFYVLDLPDLMIDPKSYFVAAAAFPFSFQSHTNSIAANFNWNSPAPSRNGKLTKWVQSQVPDVTDGNALYNVAPIPGNDVNDFFTRLSGDVAYTMFLYKNGVLVNRVIGGAGGIKSLSQAVTSMPALKIDMLSDAPDFTINFLDMVSMPIETIIMDAGSDNGFIRETDGGCGTWKKSSATVNHTPNASNGTMTTSGSGEVTITSNIIRGTVASGSTIIYSASSSSDVFPLELRVYSDNGLVQGQFDIGDSLVDTKSATISGQSFSTTFKPYNLDVLIIARQASGCVDRITFTAQGSFSTLPVAFEKITGNDDATANVLKWSMSDNSGVSYYIVQRSTDQRNYSDIASVLNNPLHVTYQFRDKELINTISKYFYRVVAIGSKGARTSSSICLISRSVSGLADRLVVYPNPFVNQISMVLPQSWVGKKGVAEVLSSGGATVRTIYLDQVNSSATLKIENLAKGMYLIKITCEGETLQKTIVKN